MMKKATIKSAAPDPADQIERALYVLQACVRSVYGSLPYIAPEDDDIREATICTTDNIIDYAAKQAAEAIKAAIAQHINMQD